ncbi:hypothetical protein [Dissulfurispira sp.]|uniref:hypothetical protein n=1 Tax=Dissulfurispira sp. TaxID=2817609 RepID=UPI002FDA181A
MPLSVLSDFINTFLSIFFHPLKFFSSNYFSDSTWSRNAIKYFVIAYILLFISLVYNVKDMNNTVQTQLSQIKKESFSNIEKIDDIKKQMDQFTKNLEEQSLNNWGIIVRVVGQLIFGLILVFYILLSIYSFVRRRKLPTIFKITNIFSYVVGTAAILFILPINSYSAHFKKFVELKLKCQYYDFQKAPIVLFVILGVYIFSLFCIGLRHALGLEKAEIITLLIFSITINALINYYFFV